MLVRNGHNVLVERSAGAGSGMDDSEYAKEGAVIVEYVKDLFKKSDVIVKVKEPLESEYDLFNDGQTLFTYLHLAPTSLSPKRC